MKKKFEVQKAASDSQYLYFASKAEIQAAKDQTWLAGFEAGFEAGAKVSNNANWINILGLALADTLNEIANVAITNSGQNWRNLQVYLQGESDKLSKDDLIWKTYGEWTDAIRRDGPAVEKVYGPLHREQIEEMTRVAIAFKDGVKAVISGQTAECTQELYQAIADTNLDEFYSFAEHMAEIDRGGRDTEAHVDLIVDLARGFKAQGYTWKQNVVEIRKHLINIPREKREERHTLALGQLESYGNFWDKEARSWDRDALEKAVNYIRTTIHNRGSR